MSSKKSKASQKSRKVKSKSRKSKASQKSRQSKKQSKRLEREIKLSKEMSKRMSKKTPMIASSHGISLLKRSKRNMSKGRPLASARDFLLATSILTAALSPYDPHPMAKKSKIAPNTQVHLDWHKGQFPDKQLTSKQYKKLMKRSKKGKKLATIQEGGMKKGTPITVHWPHDDGKKYPYTMTYWGEYEGKHWAKHKGYKYDITDYGWEVIEDRFEKNAAEIPEFNPALVSQQSIDFLLLGEEHTTPKQSGTETTSEKLKALLPRGTKHLKSKKAAEAMIAELNKKGGKWSLKYKRKINCKRPKGFSQKQYCKRISKKKKKRRTKKNRKKRTKKRRRK
jgi:hypothetical protein